MGIGQQKKKRQNEGHKTEDCLWLTSNHHPFRMVPIQKNMINLVMGAHKASVLKRISLNSLSLMPLNIWIIPYPVASQREYVFVVWLQRKYLVSE